VSDPQPAKISRNALAAEQARLARVFQTINKHRKALDLAIEENFGGSLRFAMVSNGYARRSPG
jgi:hypothetical protein